MHLSIFSIHRKIAKLERKIISIPLNCAEKCNLQINFGPGDEFLNFFQQKQFCNCYKKSKNEKNIFSFWCPERAFNMEWYGWWKVRFNQGYTDGQGLTDDFSYDTNDTEDICDYDGREPIYKYGTKVCNQFKFCKNGEHAVGTCPEGQYFDTVVGESFISWVIQISNFALKLPVITLLPCHVGYPVPPPVVLTHRPTHQRLLKLPNGPSSLMIDVLGTQLELVQENIFLVLVRVSATALMENSTTEHVQKDNISIKL